MKAKKTCSTRRESRRFPTALALAAAIVTALFSAACEPSPRSKLDQPINAPAPAHPAMDDTAASSSASMPAGHGHGGSSLPAGHPPVDSQSTSTAATSAPEEPPSTGTVTDTGTDSGTAAGATTSDGGTVAIAGVTFAVPEGLVREQPSSSMRLAQFRLPRAEGADEDAVMTVIQAGGSLQGNIDRWRGQFDGNPEAQTEKRQLDNGAVTVVRIEGTYKGMSGPFAGGGGGAKEGQALWGAIIESPSIRGGSLFLKATGPKATIDRWNDQLRELAGSIEVQ